MRNRKSKPANPKREGRFVFCFAGTSRASAREICEELHFAIDALGSGGTRAPFWRRTSAKAGGVMGAAERSTLTARPTRPGSSGGMMEAVERFTPNRVSPGKGCSVLRPCPVSMSQMHREPSEKGLTRHRPSTIADTEVTWPECPSRMCKHVPVFMSQMRREPSEEALTRRCPSTVTDTELAWVECPSRMCKHVPVSMSQMRKEPSEEALTHRRPSAVTDTELTRPECPFRV